MYKDTTQNNALSTAAERLRWTWRWEDGRGTSGGREN